MHESYTRGELFRIRRAATIYAKAVAKAKAKAKATRGREVSPGQPTPQRHDPADIRFAPPGPLRQPHVVSWAQACRAQAVGLSGAPTTPSAVAASSAACAAAGGLAASVSTALAARGLFCSRATPCRVRCEDETLRICLPPATLSSRLCEPFGERWQQLGGLVAVAMDADGCASFNITKLRWWRRVLREGIPHDATPAFFSTVRTRLPPASIHEQAGVAEATAHIEERLRRQRFERLFWDNIRGAETCPLARKKPPALRAGADLARRFVAFLQSPQLRDETARLLARATPESGSDADADASKPARATATPASRLPYRTCAVVGSGPDLRCASLRRGAEIDGHDAVFRSNSLQHGYGQRLVVTRRNGLPTVCSSPMDRAVGAKGAADQPAAPLVCTPPPRKRDGQAELLARARWGLASAPARAHAALANRALPQHWVDERFAGARTTHRGKDMPPE
jgi:hypothetical protein